MALFKKKARIQANTPVEKTGIQSADDPFTFIMSTDTVDRHGDIVKQNWILKQFKQNPIALFMHNHTSPIGTWKNVRVSSGKLMGKLVLAKAGTSELIDTIRSLIEQGVLKAVSVGFNPKEVTAIDEEHPWRGSILDKNILLECSLVSVGANSDALIQATKSMNLGQATLDFLNYSESGNQVNESEPSKSKNKPTSRVSDNGSSKTAKTKGDIIMSLADRIKAFLKAIKASREEMDSIEKTASDEERDLTDDEIEQLDALTDDVERSIGSMEKLERIEKSRARRIQEASNDVGGDEGDDDSGEGEDTDAAKKAFGSARVVSASSKVKGHRAFATLATMVRAHIEQRNPLDVAKAHYSKEAEIISLVKAASAPARSDTTGWAEELVQETWGEFLDILRDTAVYPSVPGLRMTFDGYGKINIPRNQGQGELAGGFVAEGAPIPVKQGALDTTDLTPKSLKVISTFTREIALRSNPAIEALIRNQIMGDTSEALDTALLDAGPRDTIRPAGFQNVLATGAGNIITSAGATSANILADTADALGRVIAARLNGGGVWIMNPLRVLGLMDKQDAASGVFVFRDELQSGMFRGYPYISSTNVPAAVVYFAAEGSVAFASEYGPSIDVSNSASLHFEDTTPLDIGTDGTPNVVASPVKSLFQTDSIALRFTQGLDWRIVRGAGIQVIDGCAW